MDEKACRRGWPNWSPTRWRNLRRVAGYRVGRGSVVVPARRRVSGTSGCAAWRGRAARGRATGRRSLRSEQARARMLAVGRAARCAAGGIVVAGNRRGDTANLPSNWLRVTLRHRNRRPGHARSSGPCWTSPTSDAARCATRGIVVAGEPASNTVIAVLAGQTRRSSNRPAASCAQAVGARRRHQAWTPPPWLTGAWSPATPAPIEPAAELAGPE